MVIDALTIKDLQFTQLENITPSKPEEAYMISLDDTIYNKQIKRISLSIPIKKFDAVKGSSLSDYIKKINNTSIRAQAILESDYRDSSFDLTTLNSVGCYLSHVSLWYKVVTESLKGMYIFESDAVCFNTLNLNDFLNTDGDILLFGSRLVGDSVFVPYDYGRKFGLTKINQHFFGLHAYYITYKGALKALKNVFPIEAQIDAYLSYLSKLNLVNIYGYYPSTCTQAVHISSLQSKYVKHHVDFFLLIIGLSSFFIIIIIILSVVCFRRRHANITT
jgi:GR25 family glycosyltransferase involved in LPS biosynthesis